MQIGRETADHSDWNSRFLEQSCESCRNVNNLVHGALEYSVGEHGLYLEFYRRFLAFGCERSYTAIKSVNETCVYFCVVASRAWPSSS